MKFYFINGFIACERRTGTRFLLSPREADELRSFLDDEDLRSDIELSIEMVRDNEDVVPFDWKCPFDDNILYREIMDKVKEKQEKFHECNPVDEIVYDSVLEVISKYKEV